jgi:hypothetical protein
MGLDMYAYAVDKENAHRPYAELSKEDGDFIDEHGWEAENPNRRLVEIHYWRKHNALHGWMQSLWESRGCPLPDGREGGNAMGDFNCVPLELAEEDLKRLRDDIKNRRLKPQAGFFFGSTEYSDEDWEEYTKQDLEFVENASKVIADGGKVYYDSWW